MPTGAQCDGCKEPHFIPEGQEYVQIQVVRHNMITGETPQGPERQNVLVMNATVCPVHFEEMLTVLQPRFGLWSPTGEPINVLPETPPAPPEEPEASPGSESGSDTPSDDDDGAKPLVPGQDPRIDVAEETERRVAGEDMRPPETREEVINDGKEQGAEEKAVEDVERDGSGESEGSS